MVVQQIRRNHPDRTAIMMIKHKSLANLGKDAIKLALKGEWLVAAEINRVILELEPQDVEAANRLAKALMETGEYPAARSVLAELLERQPNNGIAGKNLARLDKLESAGGASNSGSGVRAGLSPLFIEDGGKSCTTTLRIAAAASPADPSAGDEVVLAICGEGVAAESTEGRRLGTVEPRISRRLRKLMEGGNRYSAAVVGIHGEQLSIIIREIEKHPSLRNVVSFPPIGKSAPVSDDKEISPIVYEEIDSGESTSAESDLNGDIENEDTLTALVSDSIGVDEPEDDDGDDTVPMLETDESEDDPTLGIFNPDPDEEEWE